MARAEAVAHVDQDGFGDTVTANHYSDNISVLINKLVIGAPSSPTV